MKRQALEHTIYELEEISRQMQEDFKKFVGSFESFLEYFIEHIQEAKRDFEDGNNEKR